MVGLIILVSLSVAISSCGQPEEGEEAVIVTPVEEKVVSPPVDEKVVTAPVEEMTVTPKDWEKRYGPDGEDKIITIGELYVAKRIDNAGTNRNAVMTWDEAMNWAEELDWLGKIDWRLPNQAELSMICQNNDMLGDYSDGEYWASTPHPKIPDQSAVTVNCANGGFRYRDKPGEYFVRVVRLID